MPSIPRKATSLVADILTLPERYKDVPYDQLAAKFAADGYAVYLTEQAATPTYGGQVLMTFDLLVGNGTTTERFDSVTLCMGQSPGPISIAARVAARESVTYLLTGRLPPPQNPMTAPAQQPAAGYPEQANGVDEADEPENEQAAPEGGEYVDDAPAEPTIQVVERREPDGLPVFADLYEIEGPGVTTGGIIKAVLDVTRLFLDDASSLEQVDALASKNPDMISFVQDVGTPENIKSLIGMVEEKKNILNRPVGARPAKRRVPAAARSH